jgi:hypothetical protein
MSLGHIFGHWRDVLLRLGRLGRLRAEKSFSSIGSGTDGQLSNSALDLFTNGPPRNLSLLTRVLRGKRWRRGRVGSDSRDKKVVEEATRRWPGE